MYDNYIEYEDDYESNNFPRRDLNLKKYLKYIIIVLGLVIAYLVYSYFTSYASVERKMVYEAKQYVKSHNISTSSEIYLDATKLNLELPSNCSLVSGVIYNGRDYYPYLSCSSYESKLFDNGYSGVNLLGDKITILLKGMDYADPGYISNEEVTIKGKVGSEEGVYDIYYYVGSNFVKRKIIVLDNLLLLREFPTLTLRGEQSETIDVNAVYYDKGVNAYDNVDGDITSKVQITNVVNNKTSGEYSVIYRVTNSRGYTSSIVRKVIVFGDDGANIISGLSKYSLTNQNVKIVFNILNTNYSNTILPNDEKTTQKNFEYEVEKNGVYEFKVNDVFGNTVLRKVAVSNIEKEDPDGTCYATLYNNKTEITTVIKLLVSIYILWMVLLMNR